MALTINLLDDRKRVEFKLSGVVTGKDIIDAHKKFHTKENNSSLRYKIIDKSEVIENNISVDEIKVISSLDEDVAAYCPDLIIVFVSSRYADLKTSQQWTALSGKASKNLHFFYSRKEAEEWLLGNV